MGKGHTGSGDGKFKKATKSHGKVKQSSQFKSNKPDKKASSSKKNVAIVNMDKVKKNNKKRKKNMVSAGEECTEDDTMLTGETGETNEAPTPSRKIVKESAYDMSNTSFEDIDTSAAYVHLVEPSSLSRYTLYILWLLCC